MANQYFATYSYLPGADLLTGWTQSGTGILPVSHTRSFEPNRNLITGIENMAGTNIVATFAYTNDELARRTARVDNAAVTNTFAYNGRSEVIEALLGLDQYAYAYDPIGNRLTASTPSTISTYTANELNQYTSISNGIPVAPTYDADGNMTEHDDWTYVWDGENRLAEMVNGDARLVFDYDYMGRRIRKTVYEWNTDHWSLITDHFFIYDGWNVLLELDLTQTEPDIARTYVWGLDLSQTLQGAGGVGGLLCVIVNGEPYYPAYDANGNITEYVDSSGTVVAHYEYSAFGNTIVQSGTLADTFTHRFSTKYLDAETGLYYYGYRYYSPELGRWINRDPIEEWGGPNLYGFVFNAPSILVDLLGLSPPSHFGCDDLERVLARIDAELSPNGGVGAGILNNCDRDIAADYSNVVDPLDGVITAAGVGGLLSGMSESAYRFVDMARPGDHLPSVIGTESTQRFAPHLHTAGNVSSVIGLGHNMAMGIGAARRGDHHEAMRRGGSAAGSAMTLASKRIAASLGTRSLVGKLVPYVGWAVFGGEVAAAAITAYSEHRTTRTMNEARASACEAYMRMGSYLLEQRLLVMARLGELCCNHVP